MKAIVCTRFGPPEVLQLREIPIPTPKASEVLIRVRASSINAGDWHIMRADPWFARPMFGVLKPRFPVLGADVAGTIEALGEDAAGFEVGDEVFGDISGSGFGGWAEYVTADPSVLVAKPESLSFDEAAAVPAAAVTALQGLRDAGGVQAGHRVLINGATGGVGMFAVQIAKALGAHVTAVGSGAKAEMLASLGPDRVIDYTADDFLNEGILYDAILDAAAFRSVLDFRRAMHEGSVYVLAGGSTAQFLQISFLSPWASMTGKKMKSFLARPNAKDLAFVKELTESGKVRPAIDRTFALRNVPEGVRHMEARKTRGKLVVAV